MAREPVGVATTERGFAVVVCDDGSVWLADLRGYEDMKWRIGPPVPGTEADED